MDDFVSRIANNSREGKGYDELFAVLEISVRSV